MQAATEDDIQVIKQHLIDPEICIRCNTCEATCPVGAITHDDRNYVVRSDVCNLCMACIAPCPTGSIDNWRTVPKVMAYAIEDQLGWDELPAEMTPEQLAAEGVSADAAVANGPSASDAVLAVEPSAAAGVAPFNSAAAGSTVPPSSAEKPVTNSFTPKNPAKATVVGNVDCTEDGFASHTHHIVLDFGGVPFPVLEGQSIGILPPGVDGSGRPHMPRQYSIASPRNGERPGYNNVSLTVKRVTEDHQGQPFSGVGSNYVCDLKVGDVVQVVGPFGQTFLMPNHADSHIVMICTGTGSAPMRAMTEWRRRQRKTGQFEGSKLMLFFGARTREELPYFGPLTNLPKDFIDINLAFSRTPGQPKRYVQDLIKERATDLAAMLNDPNAHFYVCGLKAMEEGVLLALKDVAEQAQLEWETIGPVLKREGRLHLETY